MDIILVIIFGILSFFCLLKPKFLIKFFFKKEFTGDRLRKEIKGFRNLGIIFLISLIITILRLFR